MPQASLEKQFAGQARLVRLLLWRIGDTTDIDECLQVAHDKGMLTADDESFIRDCLEAEESQREGRDLGIELDNDFLTRLRRCADKLNRADSA